jgi:hypothetical protein
MVDWFLNNELERNWKKVVVTEFELSFRNFLQWPQEKYEMTRPE